MLGKERLFCRNLNVLPNESEERKQTFVSNYERKKVFAKAVADTLQ